MNKAADHPDLSHVETWIFDLDNTLYPASCNLFAEIDKRMAAFIAGFLAVDLVEARKIQKAYFHSHGTTLTGLMEEHGLAPTEYLEFVHDIDLSPVPAHPELAVALARLPGRRIVYTNGSQRHAERVIEKLGLGRLIDAVHDIAAGGYCPKPRRRSYEALIERHEIAPQRSAMFEDIIRNLEVPHELGMTTVLISSAVPRDGGSLGSATLPAHVRHGTDDLAGFLARARVMAYERSPIQEREGL